MVLERTQATGRPTRKHTKGPAHSKRQRRVCHKDGDRGGMRTGVRSCGLSRAPGGDAQEGMSHEIWTSLNNLLIVAKLIVDSNKEGSLSPVQIAYAGMLFDTGHEMLARLLGGALTLPGPAGHASTFDASMPLQDAPGRALAAPADAVGLSGARVLIIDGDPRDAFALVSLLENHGATVLFAESARQGLLALESDRDVDLVLMVITLPEVNGYEATQEIHKLTPYQTLPIIAVTSGVTPFDRESYLAAGCSDVVPRPVDSARLLSVISRFRRR